MTVLVEQQQLQFVNPMPAFMLSAKKDETEAKPAIVEAAALVPSSAAEAPTAPMEEISVESDKENASTRIQLAHLTAAVELARRQATKTKQFRETPETEWAMTVSKDLPMETIRKLKSLYRDRKKEMKKARGLKLTDISSQIIFQDHSKHDHSNFAKWINDKQGRRGRGGINLVILLVWIRLCYGADESERLVKRTD